MNKDLSLVVYILDASTSMTPRQGVVSSSIKESIMEHAQNKGDTLISVYTFSSYDCIRNEVDRVNARNFADYKYSCSGWTAMYDGIAFAIDDIGQKLANMAEADRPSQVQVMIVTDGEENHSRVASALSVKERIQRQEAEYSWVFTYLGSNQDAITAGTSMGIDSARSATYSDRNLEGSLRTLNRKMVQSKGMDYDAVLTLASFNSIERERLVS